MKLTGNVTVANALVIFSRLIDRADMYNDYSLKGESALAAYQETIIRGMCDALDAIGFTVVIHSAMDLRCTVMTRLELKVNNILITTAEIRKENNNE